MGSLEIIFRIALFSDLFGATPLQNARNYADPWLDDDYWKLDFLVRQAKSQKKESPRMEVHPEYGWIPKTSQANPLGIVTADPESLARPGPALLFFGDSYVDGPEPVENKIPQLLDPMVDSRRVLNLGVSGYGVGQIYLRFMAALQHYDEAVVLIGIQDRDIDRTILTIRNSMKPRLDIVNDELVVRNQPIIDTAIFIENNPVSIRSYVLRFVLIRLRTAFPNSWSERILGYDERHATKLALNRRIFEAFKEEAVTRDIRLFFVLFYVRRDIMSHNWREQYIKETLTELEIPYFDSKEYLLDHLDGDLERVGEFWSDEHGHPNNRGNELFARGIAEFLAGNGI
jgi:lysophospholipase L1-like esterase